MADNQNLNQDNSDQHQVDWKQSLPEEVRNHPSMANLNTPADVANSWVNAQKLIGREKIPLPPENATDEDWNIVYDRLGRPKTAEEYVIPEDIVPEEIKKTISEDTIKDFKQTVHKAGLLPQQVDAIYRWYINFAKAAQENFTNFRIQNAQKAEATLRREWGGSYPEKVALARKVFEAVADADTFRLFDAGLGNDPAFLKAFAKLGEMISEDKLLGKPKSLTKTPEEAKQEISRIKSDLKHPINNEDHPEHRAALNYMNQLYQLAYPGEGRTA